MIFIGRNLVFLFLVSAFAFAEEPNKPTQENKTISQIQPIPTDTPISTSTTVKPTSPPSPLTSTTTSPTTTTTTTSPTKTTTTTPPTTTTTPIPPTTPSTTTTSTAKPTTPQPTPTPPQPAPTTPKPITKDNWTVSNSNGTICITANMVIKISVPYQSTNNKTVEAEFKVEHVENATATGTCSTPDNKEILILTWSNVTVNFTFSLNVSNHEYFIEPVNIVIPVNNFTFPNNTMTNVTEVRLSYMENLFSTPQNNSYLCKKIVPLTLSGTTYPSSNVTISGKLTVSNVNLQAFGNDKSGNYRAPMDCEQHNTPDIVPIVVGLVLAGLVIVVLVAYLVGRRRAQSRGYLSM